MAKEKPVKIIKKKVKPYPIRAVLELNAVKKPVEVIYLSGSGVIVNLQLQMVSVGEYYQLVFELPVLHDQINTQVRVLKTYDKSVDMKTKKVERFAELHFQSLTKEQRTRIVAFTAAIGQDK